MYGYDNKELLEFINEKIGDYSVSDIMWGNMDYLGQGISRTVFYYREYPDIVFKIGIGEDGVDEDTFYNELGNYELAIEEGFAEFFAPLEPIGTICLSDERDYDCYDCDNERDTEEYFSDFTIYIQPRIDCLLVDMYEDFQKGSFQRESSVVQALDDMDDYCRPADSDDASGYFLRKYGVETYRAFGAFVRNRLCLDALHNQNWAMKDGDMILIDYAM